ncbi:MAG: heavy-metal-associated domain-containing protein [Ignavibacteria bacterium]|nr:heavy-metal-associated domain-containing protein [Ignavibacteria bacterium]
MKEKRSLLHLLSALAVIMITLAFFSGCSRQDKPFSTGGSEQKNEASNQKGLKESISVKEKEGSEHKESSGHKEEADENEQKVAGNNAGNGKNSHEEIKIETTQCNTCRQNITKALKKVEGISSFEVDIDEKVVHVTFDKSKTGLSKIEQAISLAGYDANNVKADPEAYENLDDCCKKPEDRKKQ